MAGVQRTRRIRPAEAWRVRGQRLLEVGDGADRWGWQAAEWAVLGCGKEIKRPSESWAARGKGSAACFDSGWRKKKEKGRLG